MLNVSKDRTASFIHEEVTRELHIDDLITPKSEFGSKELSKKMRHLNFGPNIEHINVWNKDRTVLWSDEESLIGQRYPDNNELKKASGGEIVSEIINRQEFKEKYAFEGNYERILELYIPIRFEPDGDIDIIFEIYQNLHSVDADISYHSKIIWTSTLTGITALLFLLFWLFKGATRRIESQHGEISQAKEDWEETFNTISEAITIHDKDFNIVRANRASEELLGLSSLTITRQKCYESYHGTDCPPEGCPSCQVLKTGLPASSEVFEPKLNKYIEIKAFPRLDSSNQLIGLVHVVRDITERKQMEEALKKASGDWRITFDSTEDMMLMLDNNFNIIKVNQATTHFLERPFADILGKNYFDLFVDMDVSLNMHPLEKMKQSKKHEESEIYFFNKDMWVLVSADPIINDKGDVIGSVHIIRDITEQKEIHTQLLQVQKMDSIGRLAGGVAHDFNNLLSSIIGFTELELLKIPDNSPSGENLRIVKEAADTASALTRQLLAFSRKQVLTMKPVNLNSIIENMAKMLGRVIREDVVLELHTDALIKTIMADVVQIEQILMNLTINARDAMPNGGTLIIETSNIELDSAYIMNHENINTGSYVLLSVTDTGIGMSRKIQKEIFEPFFTTKRKGQGTGLGLSTVYGIVKQHSGYIYVYSEVGKGTTFKVYLPVSNEDKQKSEKIVHEPLAHGTETVLVVDDDPQIRRLVQAVLKPLGYVVLEASCGKDALKLDDTYEKPIDVLLTDVIMPEMSGKEFADTFQARHPEAKVIFMSGYTDDVIAHHGILDSGVTLLEKPLSHSKLANKLREVLDK